MGFGPHPDVLLYTREVASTVIPEKACKSQKRVYTGPSSTWISQSRHQLVKVSVIMTIQRNDFRVPATVTFAKLLTTALAASALLAGRAVGQTLSVRVNCTTGSFDQLAACPQSRPNGELCRNFIGALPTRDSTEVNCLQLMTTQTAFIAACPGAFVCDKILVPGAGNRPPLAAPTSAPPEAPNAAALPPSGPSSAVQLPPPMAQGAPSPAPRQVPPTSSAPYGLSANRVGYLVAGACTTALIIGLSL
jgi:hypothetical protein